MTPAALPFGPNAEANHTAEPTSPDKSPKASCLQDSMEQFYIHSG